MSLKECYGVNVYPKGSPKIAFEGKHIYIYESKPKPQTKVWLVFNYCNDFLGEIRWYGKWRQYVLFAEKRIFGGSCFYEIGDFCKEQTAIQKEKWNHGDRKMTKQICLRPKKFVFRIRHQYFSKIREGKKTIEYRRDSPFWRKRIGIISESTAHFDISDYTNRPIAIFICGKRIHKREIVGISRIDTPITFSEQGKKDVDTPLCFAFHLGKEVKS